MLYHRRSFLFGISALATLPLASAQTKPPTDKLISAARQQIGVTTSYDGGYRTLSYPNGDLSRQTGVCTDVIIRAYRDAFNFDLQKAVHEDINANFSAYPNIWGLSHPDRNIDHRRVPNLETYLQRQGAEQTIPDDLSKLRAGELVTIRLPRNLPHIAIVSNKVDHKGWPDILHNIGAGTREEPLANYNLHTLLHKRFSYFRPSWQDT